MLVEACRSVACEGLVRSLFIECGILPQQSIHIVHFGTSVAMPSKMVAVRIVRDGLAQFLRDRRDRIRESRHGSSMSMVATMSDSATWKRNGSGSNEVADSAPECCLSPVASCYSFLSVAVLADGSCSISSLICRGEVVRDRSRRGDYARRRSGYDTCSSVLADLERWFGRVYPEKAGNAGSFMPVLHILCDPRQRDGTQGTPDLARCLRWSLWYHGRCCLYVLPVKDIPTCQTVATALFIVVWAGQSQAQFRQKRTRVYALTARVV